MLSVAGLIGLFNEIGLLCKVDTALNGLMGVDDGADVSVLFKLAGLIVFSSMFS